MTETTIQVNENMADFISWANSKGEDEIRRLIREHLSEIKKQSEISGESRVDDGYQWDDAMEPNDDVDQWKHGGDCNLCRKADYCMTKCRANRKLKAVTTPYLYSLYLQDVPEAAAKSASAGINTEALMRQAGVLQ